ncbi:putative protease [Rhizomicrobium palustre]|uniref:Ubiquinone biosynthesis protein UbiU n=1 Tax=Rhizomicrobium palustre TaxID=189966 RepID=A0A846N0M8_9PROT|nr:peptidase U32 family protein [Rhizomicrobium palustre]NIK88901.1 putative protease [Rhizomicrobium palustre]
MSKNLELVCPAGTPAGLRTAVDAGAHSVYCGFRDETNARNFPGLNFDRDEMREAAQYAHERGAKILIALNTFMRAGSTDLWKRGVDDAVAAGADALILADIALVDYARKAHPKQRLHLSVQAAAATPEAIAFYRDRFGISRIVLPRVLTVEEIARLSAQASPCETEVFVFGGLCVMAEGRCMLSSYATGKSPNMAGVCSPPSHVTYREDRDALVASVGGFTIERFERGEPAGYPTLCKGRFLAEGAVSHLFEDPVSLNAVELLPRLAEIGVTAFKIEGRQRGRAYISTVVRTFRKAIDAMAAGKKVDFEELRGLTEGQRDTVGAYKKAWR